MTRRDLCRVLEIEMDKCVATRLFICYFVDLCYCEESMNVKVYRVPNMLDCFKLTHINNGFTHINNTPNAT